MRSDNHILGDSSDILNEGAQDGQRDQTQNFQESHSSDDSSALLIAVSDNANGYSRRMGGIEWLRAVGG